MKLYHGSDAEIPRPKLSRGKPRNDYGRGFYCTEDVFAVDLIRKGLKHGDAGLRGVLPA